MKKILRWSLEHWVLSLVGIGIISGGYYFFFTEEAPAQPGARIQMETVEKGTIKIGVSGSGQIEADSQVDLKAVVAGDAIEITSVSVKNDQAVQKGQIIATLDSEDAVRDMREAELSLKSAKIKMQQTENDFPAKTEAQTLTRRVQEIAVKQQEMSLANTRSRLSDYTIRAPFEGIVTDLSVDAGDAISQSDILASVITREMKAVISLNEVDAAKVKVGNGVSLTFDALPNTTIQGTISKLDSIGTAVQGVVSYGAEISLLEQNSSLKPGMTVAAEIAVEEKKDVLLVPNEAITYEDGKAFVRTAEARGTANAMPDTQTQRRANVQRGERKEIVVGITDNIHTEIISGLSVGDTVLVTAPASTQASSALPRATGQTQGGVLNSLLRGGRTGGNASGGR